MKKDAAENVHKKIKKAVSDKFKLQQLQYEKDGFLVEDIHTSEEIVNYVCNRLTKRHIDFYVVAYLYQLSIPRLKIAIVFAPPHFENRMVLEVYLREEKLYSFSHKDNISKAREIAKTYQKH
jgi:hypothetical protein